MQEPPPRGQRGNWIEHIHRLWGETWIPGLTLAMRVRRAADDRVRLDDRQLALLDALDDTPVSWSMARPAAAPAALNQ